MQSFFHDLKPMINWEKSLKNPANYKRKSKTEIMIRHTMKYNTRYLI